MTTPARPNGHASVAAADRRGRFLTMPNGRALAQTSELPQAFHLRARRQRPILFHHLAHLHVLLDDLVHFLHARAAALGDALAPLPVNHVMVAALLVGHGIDYGFDLL